MDRLLGDIAELAAFNRLAQQSGGVVDRRPGCVNGESAGAVGGQRDLGTRISRLDAVERSLDAEVEAEILGTERECHDTRRWLRRAPGH